MSARRAAIRRERMQRKKIAKHNSTNGELERVVEKGTLEGRVLAVYTVFTTLKEHYNFGKTKLEKLLNLSNKEAVKFEQPATQFTMKHYQKRMMERIAKNNSREVYKQDIKEEIYVMRRNDVFVSSCSMMFIVLNQDFGFSSNSKGTGRIDKIMNYVLEEFEKVQSNYDIGWYIRELEEKTKVSLV